MRQGDGGHRRTVKGSMGVYGEEVMVLYAIKAGWVDKHKSTIIVGAP